MSHNIQNSLKQCILTIKCVYSLPATYQSKNSVLLFTFQGALFRTRTTYLINLWCHKGCDAQNTSDWVFDPTPPTPRFKTISSSEKLQTLKVNITGSCFCEDFLRIGLFRESVDTSIPWRPWWILIIWKKNAEWGPYCLGRIRIFSKKRKEKMEFTELNIHVLCRRASCGAEQKVAPGRRAQNATKARQKHNAR